MFIYHIAVLSQHPGLKILRDIHTVDFVLNAFFVISGFLVFMSFENSESVVVYFEKRLRRIFPAYFAIVLLCAILGCFLSSSSFAEYFSSKQFVNYLIFNTLFMNFIEPCLPGVFALNNLMAVNGSLWTIRNEILCYIIVPSMVYLFRRYNRVAVFILLYVATYLVYALLLSYADTAYNSHIAKLHYVPWHILCFMSGSIVYYFFDIVRSKFYVVTILALLVYLGGGAADITLFKPLSLALLIVSGACFFPYLGNFAKFGDLSYGVYIFHFPIVQTVISYHVFHYSLAAGLSLSVAVVLLLSFISWHVLERPFLKRSSHYLVAGAQK